MAAPKISIVVPVYNESEGLAGFLPSLLKAVEDNKIDAEVIVVDDGSTDGSADAVKAFKDVRLVTHPYNKGYGAALKTGAREAVGEWVLFIDGDGQHKPEDILKFLPYLDDFDMVVGERVYDEGAVFSKNLAKWLLNGFARWLAHEDIKDLNSGFRAVRRGIIVDHIEIFPNTFSVTTTLTMVCWRSAFNIKYVPISVSKRVGKSKVRVSDFLRFLGLMFRTAILFNPLKVAAPLGFITLSAGVGYGVLNILFSCAVRSHVFYGIAYCTPHWDLTDTSLVLFLLSVVIVGMGVIASYMSELMSLSLGWRRNKTA